MIRVGCIRSGFLPVNRDRIEQAKGLFRKAFPQITDAQKYGRLGNLPHIGQQPGMPMNNPV